MVDGPLFLLFPFWTLYETLRFPHDLGKKISPEQSIWLTYCLYLPNSLRGMLLSLHSLRQKQGTQEQPCGKESLGL